MKKYLKTFLKFISLFFLLSSFIIAHASSDINNQISIYNDAMEKISLQSQELDKYKQDLKEIFKNRAAKYEDIFKKLNSIDKNLRSNNYQFIHEEYNYALNLWRSFVEDSFSNISGATIQYDYPKKIISHINFSTDFEITKEHVELFDENYNNLSVKFRESIVLFEQLQEKDSLQYTKILLYSGKLRSKLFQKLKELNDNTVLQISNDTLLDLWREVHIIPLRWTATFYSKFLEFKNNFNTGFSGYLLILKEMSIFCVLIAFIITFTHVFKVLSYRFDIISENIIKKSYKENQHWLWQYFLTLINKFIPWVLLLLGIKPLESILNQTTINEVSELLPYLEYYIYYRIILIFTTYSITKAKTQGIITFNYIKQAKLLRSLSSMYKFVLFNMLILHTIDTVVGKAITYGIYSQFFTVSGIIYVILISDKWRLEIFSKIHTILPSKFFRSLKISFRKVYSPLVSFIFLNFIFVHHIYFLLKTWLGKFDFSKKISAQLFLALIKKSKIKSTNNNLQELPCDYINKFDLENIHLTSKREEFDDCVRSIDHWLQDKNSINSVLIYGAYGSGKSTLIQSLKKNFSEENFNILHLNYKITSSNILIDKLKEILGGQAKDLKLLIEEWSKSINKKTIICIDDAHNLFLAKPKGFEALKSLMKIINSDIKDVFWCITFHRYSWPYITQVLSSYQSFDKVIELEPWSADELQKLILNIHKGTKYNLSFDNIFYTLDKKNLNDVIDNVKNKFFKILWDHSAGNPAYALRLWLSSLYFDGKNTLYVCLPPVHTFVNLLEMDDDIHFICSAVNRHEVLSRSQIKKVVNKDDGVITRILKICLEKNLLFEDENKNFRLNTDYACNIIKALKRKNYVY